MAYIKFNVPVDERKEFLGALNLIRGYSPQIVSSETHEIEGNVMIENFGLEGFDETTIAVEFVNIGESGIQYIVDDPYDVE